MKLFNTGKLLPIALAATVIGGSITALADDDNQRVAGTAKGK